MICRPLSLSILDQAPLWLSVTCVKSVWLVNIHDGSRTGSLSLARATCYGWLLHRVWSITPLPTASQLDDQSLPRGGCCSSLHLEEWELRPPSNYQLSSRPMSRCCPSPVFTVSDKRIAASRMLCSNAAWKKANHLTALLLTASIFALLFF